MVPEPTRALYVRVPAALAEKLDRAAERLGTSKREVITRLVGQGIGIEEELKPQRFWAAPESEVLTLEEAADLLRVEPADVTELVEAGDLPARRIGAQWRLSRAAVMEWLRAQT
jgi:excisionase family DNA binding protein